MTTATITDGGGKKEQTGCPGGITCSEPEVFGLLFLLYSMRKSGCKALTCEPSCTDVHKQNAP
jgi:hypothetical protein